MKRLFAGLVVGSLTAGFVMLSPGSAYATLEMQKQAKAAGFEVANCLYCHNEKLPKKGAVTSNERGQWLADQKQKKGAKEIDFAWLKDYTPAKK